MLTDRLILYIFKFVIPSTVFPYKSLLEASATHNISIKFGHIREISCIDYSRTVAILRLYHIFLSFRNKLVNAVTKLHLTFSVVFLTHTFIQGKNMATLQSCVLSSVVWEETSSTWRAFLYDGMRTVNRWWSGSLWRLSVNKTPGTLFFSVVVASPPPLFNR